MPDGAQLWHVIWAALYIFGLILSACDLESSVFGLVLSFPTTNMEISFSAGRGGEGLATRFMLYNL